LTLPLWRVSVYYKLKENTTEFLLPHISQLRSEFTVVPASVNAHENL